MAWASSSTAASTMSTPLRLCPRWITSAPEDWRIRRKMLIEASCPSNSVVAVTNLTLLAN